VASDPAPPVTNETDTATPKARHASKKNSPRSERKEKDKRKEKEKEKKKRRKSESKSKEVSS
jgi:hypothetical protein